MRKREERKLRAEDIGVSEQKKMEMTNWNVFSCNTGLRFFWCHFLFGRFGLIRLSKAEQSVGSKQITLINTGCNLENTWSSVRDMEAIEVGNKTNSTVAVSLKSWHLHVWAKNCTHSATWPNYKCSHPKHQHLLLLFPSRAGRSVAIVVWLEGPLWGKTQVLGLLVCQLGELHSQFVQVSSCHLLVQLLKQTHDRWFLLDQIAIDQFILTLFCLILMRNFWWLTLI